MSSKIGWIVETSKTCGVHRLRVLVSKAAIATLRIARDQLRRLSLQGERDHFARRVAELEAHNLALTEAAITRAQRVAELEPLQGERDHFAHRAAELEAHNLALTEAATARAQRVAELERELAEAKIELTTAVPEYVRLKSELKKQSDEGLPVLPSLLIATIPKSGSVFTAKQLACGLGLETNVLTVGSFPHYCFDISRLARFARGGRISVEHFDASAENLQVLKAFVERLVVHIRDPRSVLLSWVHHLSRIYQERDSAPYELQRNNLLRWPSVSSFEV
jgi:hypothetical protein